VLDVGGTPHIWRTADVSYEVILLNQSPAEMESGGYRCVIGDGRDLQFPDKSFDVAFSNSVIEHVGNWRDKQRFASELRRVGKAYYCQTPNKWFPIEPHFGALFIHWWPRLLDFYFVTRCFTLWGLLDGPSRLQVERSLANIRPLSRQDLTRLFPGATIIAERFLFLSKSYVVMERAGESGIRFDRGVVRLPMSEVKEV
jgi:hypothetical protein